MPRFAALAFLALIGATAGCFNVNYGNCRITCSDTEACPSGLACMLEPGKNHGLCAEPGGRTCSFPDDMDGGPPPDASDASDVPDAMDAPDGEVLPPKVLCRDTDCLELSDALRANLVLLLWPSNLPTDAGAEVPVWLDQSGKGNDAHALSSVPHVISTGVKLDTTTPGSGFFVRNSQSLDFAAGDFTVIVVAGLVSNTQQVALFTKADGARPPAQRQVTLDWKLSSATSGRPRAIVNDTSIESPFDTHNPTVAVYGIQRVADHVELRMNGMALNSFNLAAGTSTTNSEVVYLGTGSVAGDVADSIAAVIAVRGEINSTDRDALESFLERNFRSPR